MKIYLIHKHDNHELYNFINKLHLKHDKNCSIALLIKNDTLELHHRNNIKQNPIKVDFTSKQNYQRCYYFEKKNHILSKAIGIKKNYYPFVLDATAGLGTDAFFLSFLGCKVLMIERNPIIFALLKNGLQRGYKDKNIGLWLKKRLHLILHDSINMLNIPILKPDVIYLDPMYPYNKKQALPKKNMQIFRKLIGYDEDSEKLLYVSRKLAKKRIVVKRSTYANPLSKNQINFIIRGKTHRFDIYNPV